MQLGESLSVDVLLMYIWRYKDLLVAAKKPNQVTSDKPLTFDVKDEFIKEIALNK
jgi:hypothetical protein